MEDKVQQFEQQYVGKANVGDTPQNTGQCVGLVEVYTDFLGLPHTWGNAIDLLSNADKTKFQVIYNNPNDLTQFPPIGAIIVLGEPYGKVVNPDGTVSYMGHTGIIVAANGTSFSMFAQNNPAGSTPHIEDHPEGYVNCVGWMIPILPASVPAVTGGALNTYGLDPSNIASVQVVYDTWHNVVIGQYVPVDQYNALKASVSSETGQVSSLQGQLEDAIAKQGTLQKQIDTLNSTHVADLKEIAALNGSLADITGSNKDYANEILASESLANDRLSYIHSMTDALHIPQTNQDDKALVEEALTEIARLQKTQQPTQGETEKTLSLWENHFLTIIQGLLTNGRLNAWLSSHGYKIIQEKNVVEELNAPDLGEKVVDFLNEAFTQLTVLEQAQAKLMAAGQSAKAAVAKGPSALVKLGYAIAGTIFTDKFLGR